MPLVSSPPTLIDADGRVALDLPCLTCGYNLRTLREDGACPECSAAVAPALHARRRNVSRLRWLRDVRDGLAFIQLGLLLPLLCLVMVITPVAILSVPTAAIGMAFILVGFAALGSRDPSWPEDAPDPAGPTARHVLIGCLIAIPAVWPLLCLVLVPGLGLLVVLVEAAALLVLPLAALRFVAQLVRELGAPDVARSVERLFVPCVAFEIAIVAVAAASASGVLGTVAARWLQLAAGAMLAALLAAAFWVAHRVRRIMNDAIRAVDAAGGPAAGEPAPGRSESL